MVAVYSDSPQGRRHLLLHNVDVPVGEIGDWTWGSPSGCREPDEDSAGCAARELFEEAGIRGEPVPVVTEQIAWAVYALEVPWGTEVTLSSEHNDFTWATREQMVEWCQPERLAVSVGAALAAIDRQPLRG